MLKNLITILLNLALRGLSLGGKFLLIFFIGKYLTVNELGVYGIFNTSVMLGFFLLGLSFYSYNTREVLAADPDKRLPYVRDQFVFHLIAYLLLLPFFYLLFVYNVIPRDYVWYFYILLVMEHLAQEYFRLFTVFSKVIFANFLLFLRSGLWVFILAVFWYFNIGDYKNLKYIFMFWIAGDLLTLIIGTAYFFTALDLGKLNGAGVNWRWIAKGVKISIPFFISSAAYNFLEYVDRYFIDYYLTKTDVGIYTFFNGVAKLIHLGVFTIVIMVYYPRLVEFFGKDNAQFKKYLRIFSWQNIIFSLLGALTVILLIKPLLQFAGKEEFVNNINLFYLLVAVYIMHNISLIPHYILYVKKLDTILMYSTVVPLILNMILNIVFIKLFALSGAAMAKVAAFFLIIILKFYFSRKYGEETA